jgi:uncharacterized membrane protein
MEQKSFGLSTNRIEAFTDGVFAVAITLLILEVKVPVLEGEGGSLWSALVPLWPKLLAYAVSFGIIGIFWVGHHIMFHYIKRSNRVLLWLNTLLLMFISAIPFAAALIGEHRHEPVAVAGYGILLAFAGLIYLVIWLYASRNHRLIRENTPHDLIALGTKAVLIAPITYALAATIAFWYPTASQIIYLLVPILYLIPSPIDRLVHFKPTE